MGGLRAKVDIRESPNAQMRAHGLTQPVCYDSCFGQSIDDRVRDLERRVEQLEKQAKQSASSPSQLQIAGGQDRWKQVENWRSLKRGMTEADVRRLLGEPHKVNATARFTAWQYQPGADVVFDRDGRVGAWTEPSR
jgi:hypothetical protein